MRLRTKIAVVAVAAGLCVGGERRSLHARSPTVPLGLGGSLATLALPRPGTPKHDGTWDRSGGNSDLSVVGPGQTLTVFAYRGAGIVRRFWMTLLPRLGTLGTREQMVAVHRQLILRMYWDSERTPSVEVPVGDFFGVGFGEQRDYVSLPLSETSGGYSCYWPMPFHKSARWTLTNMSSGPAAVWVNVDFTAFRKLPKNVRHFHAQWRRENPTSPDRNYTILEAAGEGHFVGTALFMQSLRGADLSLEGDEMIFLDGEQVASIKGTGTEDYFSGGFHFDRGAFSAPYHGAPLADDALGRISAYRWHIEDALPFTRSIRVTIEHGSENDAVADYSSVAYFYQREPHAPFPPFPADPSLLLPSVSPPQ